MIQKQPLTLICVQPCIPYYAWQVEVMLTNFSSLGIENDFDIHCLFAYNENESDYQKKIDCIKEVEKKFSHVADFFYYQDTRKYPISYISSIRPNVLKQHYEKYLYLSFEAVFYHDCDMVFTKYPDFLKKYMNPDFNWYVSDTISYIGHEYILSKGQDVMDAMCEIVGIDEELVKQKQNESGGAQYIIKNVDSHFFHKVEIDSERLFKQITELNNKKKQADPSHHELQIWCADMWALLWNAWLYGFRTKIIPEMNFTWATDDIRNIDSHYIFHNAGVVAELRDTHFLKSDYRLSAPKNIDYDKYDKTRASYFYVQIIKSLYNEQD